jgi:Immunity protein 26
MERHLKRQQRTVGAIVRVPLAENRHTYARILESRFAFYDAYSQEELSIEDILKKPILFLALVYDTAVTQGYWLKISKAIPLEEALKSPNLPPVFIRDVLNPSFYQIMNTDGSLRTATAKECEGLESFSAWSHSAMEERLNAHYSARKNEFDQGFDFLYSKISSNAKPIIN